MSASVERRKLDYERLRNLESRSGGRIVFDLPSSDLTTEFFLRVFARTIVSPNYPNESGSGFSLRVTLPARYPYEKPQFGMTSPIFHPHVFESGTLCIGDVWYPSETVDKIVKRVIEGLLYDASRINPLSPANRTALNWYQNAIKKFPGQFPSDRISLEESSPKRRRTWDTEEPLAPGKTRIKTRDWS